MVLGILSVPYPGIQYLAPSKYRSYRTPPGSLTYHFPTQINPSITTRATNNPVFYDPSLRSVLRQSFNRYHTLALKIGD